MADLQRSEPLLPSLGREPKAFWSQAWSGRPWLSLVQYRSFAPNLAAVVVAAAVVLIVGVVVAILWAGIGDSDISPAGWIAMGLGVIITLALGVGLMALVFISSRRGYDEFGRGSSPARPADSGE
jgi:hypothetical protein